MSTKREQYPVWCGAAATVLVLGGLWLSHWFPVPQGTGVSGPRMSELFQHHTTEIRIGQFLVMVGSALFCPFLAAIVGVVRRMDGGGELAADIQLIFGAALVIDFVIPPMLIETIALRPNRSPDVTLAFTDLFSLLYVANVFTFIAELVLLGFVLRKNRASANPSFPSWMVPWAFGTAFASSIAGLSIFFLTGPLAWDGWASWWVPVVSYADWIVVWSYFLLRADVPRIDRAAGSAPAVPATLRG